MCLLIVIHIFHEPVYGPGYPAVRREGTVCGGDTGGLAHVLLAYKRRHQLVRAIRLLRVVEGGSINWVDLALDPPPRESGLQFSISGHQRKGIGGWWKWQSSSIGDCRKVDQMHDTGWHCHGCQTAGVVLRLIAT